MELSRFKRKGLGIEDENLFELFQETHQKVQLPTYTVSEVKGVAQVGEHAPIDLDRHQRWNHCLQLQADLQRTKNSRPLPRARSTRRRSRKADRCGHFVWQPGKSSKQENAGIDKNPYSIFGLEGQG
jgi:hypothetical protein